VKGPGSRDQRLMAGLVQFKLLVVVVMQLVCW
jgi:hypothetical protein